MQAGLDRGDSENSDLVAWTEQMRASCFISDAPCRALSDVVQHKKPGEDERGAQDTAEEGGQGAQIQALDSHKVPFICYFAMSTLLSIKQAGETPNPSQKTQIISVGSKVELTSDYKNYDDAGQGPLKPGQFGIVIEKRSNGSFRVKPQSGGFGGALGGGTCEWWYGAKALKLVDEDVGAKTINSSGAPAAGGFAAFAAAGLGAPAAGFFIFGVTAAHSGGGTVDSVFGAAATSNPTKSVEWRKRIDEAVERAMLPEVKSSLSALQKYLEDRRADDFDEELFLSQLAASLSRLSIVTLHLLKLVPLAALSELDSYGVAELSGHGARDGEAPFRSLMSVALRLMIRKHKEPLIKEILQLDSSSARQSLPEVKVDRFQALKDPGDKLQHTIFAQIQRQLGLNATAMRGDRWWKVSFVGMQIDQNEAAQQDDPEFENFAKANKMQKCPRCSAWVQKTDGCDAMHCLCNQVFCYICAGVLKEGTGIKQCKCPGVASLLQAHEGRANHNMRPEVEAAWYHLFLLPSCARVCVDTRAHEQTMAF
jgi:hypothetical protein